MSVQIKANTDGSAAIQVNGGDRLKINVDGGVNNLGPTFSAYLSGSAQVVAPATSTKIILNTKEWDTANAFDATTNYRFQPLIAGYYFIACEIYFSSSVQTTDREVMLYKNGAVYRYLNDMASSAAADIKGGSTLVYLNGSTDYVELYTYQNSGQNMNIGVGSYGTYMTGFLARAA